MISRGPWHYLLRLRINAGASQCEVAEYCGVHQTAVSRWENGREQPGAVHMLLLAMFYGIDAGEMLKQTATKFPARRNRRKEIVTNGTR